MALAALLALGSAGCLKQMILDGQIASTRKASAATSTLSDFEVAKGAAFAGMAQFEGMHYLAPENQNGLFLLTKGWAGVGFGFIEDEMEQAQDVDGEDSELAQYHKARAIAAYERAIYYGVELLDSINPGFEKAKAGGAENVKAWLAGFDDAEEHTPYLFWTGQAWLSRTNLLKDEPAVVAELFVGALMMEHAVALDEQYNYGMGHAILGAYHSRSALAELDLAKQHFERALAINGGKALLTQFNFATKYFCAKVDKDSYVKLLTEVLEAGDVLPEQRLQNTIAKRRARRYLASQRMAECGFDMSVKPGSAKPAKSDDGPLTVDDFD